MTMTSLTINPEDVRSSAGARPAWLEQVAAYVQQAAADGETVTLTAKRRMMTPEQVADAMGVSRPTISRKIKAGEDVMCKPLSAAEASDVAASLAKAVYSALFNHLIAQINGALSESSRGKAASSISILDIYGFECFQRNSFEQLCINYANEQLQQQFNR